MMFAGWCKGILLQWRGGDGGLRLAGQQQGCMCARYKCLMPGQATCGAQVPLLVWLGCLLLAWHPVPSAAC